MTVSQKFLSGVDGEALDEERKDAFERNGFLILEGFFEQSRVQRLKEHIDNLWKSRGTNCPLVIDKLDNRGNPQRVYFRDVGLEVRETPYKLLDLHLVDEVI